MAAIMQTIDSSVSIKISFKFVLLSQSVLTCCELDPWEQITMQFESKAIFMKEREREYVACKIHFVLASIQWRSSQAEVVQDFN